MVKRQQTGNTSSNFPLRFWLLAGASSVVLTGLVGLVTTRTVHADAGLTRSAVSAPLAAPVLSSTPPSLAPQEPTETKRAHRLHGIASWYGKVFHGRRTASGERFNMYAMTACHPTLPFGTLVRVVNRQNKKSVIVRITDRGDLVDEGRIIDLSFGAAQRLSMTTAGLAQVDIQVLKIGHQRYHID
jgi:rare lipoprotein A